MFSLAGKRPGARRFASPGKHDRAQPGYLKPLHRSYKIDPLGPDAIKPLVALAYTSKSVEVRRDAAAALCTLAQNPDNLPVLGRSGALGATLALLGDGRGDDAIVRDATAALGQLVLVPELADRFLINPRGLETVLALLRAPAPRAALAVVANLACRGGDAIVARGGLRPLVALLRAPRHDVRDEAAGVVAELARRARDRAALGADGAVVRATLALLAEESTDREEVVEAAVVGFVAALAAAPGAAAALVAENGAPAVLCAKLRDQSPPLETVARLLRATLSLAEAPATRAALVAAGALDAVARAAFEDLPARFGVASLNVLGPVDGEGGAPAPRGGRGPGGAPALAACLADPRAAPRRIVHYAVAVVDALSQDAPGAAAVVEARVLPHVVPVATVTFRRDRRLGRVCARILRRCALAARDQPSEAEARRMAHALAAQGALAALGHHLAGRDLDERASAAHALAALSDARDVSAALLQPAVLAALVALAHVPEHAEAAVRLVSIAADKPRAARALLDGGAHTVLLGLVPAALGRSAPGYAVDALTATARLLEAATRDERDAAARAPSLRAVRRAAKTDHPARAAAKHVLRALGQEASLVLVQLAILSFLRKFRDPAWRRRFRAARRR